MKNAFDLIGDIHGHADKLEQLLQHLGYTETDGVYRHADRRVIFLGDFIDSKEKQKNRRVLEIARPMVENGDALAVMGNHEYNAICYHTPELGGADTNLRANTEKNTKQHKYTLEDFDGGNDKPALAEMVDWFRTLPLFLDLGDLRVVHACWDEPSISYLKKTLGSNAILNEEFLLNSARKGSDEHEAVETVLKGAEFDLPSGITFPDSDGNKRHEARIRWWLSEAESLHDMVIGPRKLESAVKGQPPRSDALLGYDDALPPVFCGHYWLEEPPRTMKSNVACLDFSVARGGKLVAYRWDGEQTLDSGKFAWVDN